MASVVADALVDNWRERRVPDRPLPHRDLHIQFRFQLACLRGFSHMLAGSVISNSRMES
jgi:hypothetical protein